MKKALLIVCMAIILIGCSKPTIQSTWEVSAIPVEDEKVKLVAQLQRVKTTPTAIFWTKVQIEQMNLPPLTLKLGQESEDIIPEPDISRTMKSKACYDFSGRGIIFEFVVKYGEETYSTNGITNIK
jgi:hypothetical protein